MAGLPTGKTRFELFKEGLYSGIGWSVGVTLGFAAVSTVIVFVLGNLGGLPIVGGFLADIVDATTAQLQVKTPQTQFPSNNRQLTPTVFLYQE
jgi:hypothetical protein